MYVRVRRCPPTSSGGILFFVAAPLAFEGGHGLARIDHDRGRLTATTTLPHDFGRQLLDRLVGRGHRLLSLSSEFGLAECGPWTSLFHRKNITLECGLGMRFERTLHDYFTFCD